MKKSLSFALLTTASLLAVSASSYGYRNYNYKGEYDYKGEVIAPAPLLCRPEKCLRDGFYVGAGVSYDSYKFKETSSLVASGVVFASETQRLSAKGWDGNLFAGYGQYYTGFYFGGEIFGTISNAQTTPSFNLPLSGTSYTATFKARSSYGIGLLPGIKVNNSTLLYARVGYIRTNFRLSEVATLTGTPYSSSTTKWKNGLSFGVGMETAIYDNWSVRGDYTYTSYSSINTTGSFAQLSSEVSPSNTEYTLGLIYHFC